MAQTQIKIRRRIKSVESTLQITKAMELVAASRLQRNRSRMLRDKVYADTLYYVMGQVLSAYQEEAANEREKRQEEGEEGGRPDLPYLADKGFHKPLVIALGADNGMCGAYNMNQQKFLEENLKEGDLFVPCGDKLVGWAQKSGISVLESYPAFDHASVEEAEEIARKALKMFDAGEISEIRVMYTEYVSAGTFVPKMVTLLPLRLEEGEKRPYTDPIELAPSPQSVLQDLVPVYLQNLMYSYLLRSKTSEQASRRLAMQMASDNAEDLKEELTLEYNKARQASITQEITEISVSGMSRG